MTEWISISELAAAALPGLPGSERGIRKQALREGWDLQPGKSRKGDGGAVEYHVSLLPKEARGKLAFLTASHAPTSKERECSKQLWARFDLLSTDDRAECQRRLDVLIAVDDMRAAGIKNMDAVARVVSEFNISERTYYNWRQMVAGQARHDWLAALAPAFSPIVNGVVPERAACDPRAWEFLKSDFLRPERPALSACLRRMRKAAQEHGWTSTPSDASLRRRLAAEVPHAVKVYAREGKDKAKRMIPAQRRSRNHLHAMQMVNTDGHKLDLFVRVSWSKKPVRMFLLGIQDIYSGKVLSFRLCEAETWDAVRGAIGDMAEHYGLPKHIIMDNGRAFASKKISGGAIQRNRFKVKEDEVAGLLKTLGIEPHFTKPYSGQSKPIERAWKDLAEEIAKHPSMAGAYTGNRPDAKPENYGNSAIPLEVLQQHVAEQIAEHNARPGRNTETARGRSFDQTFEENMLLPSTASEVAFPTTAQRSIWLLAAEPVIARKPSGEIHIGKNRYWAVELQQWIGKKVTARFDPGALHSPIKVYDPKGRLICDAPCIDDSGFDSLDAARRTGRLVSTIQRTRKEEAAAHKQLSAMELAALLRKGSDVVQPEKKAPRPVVTRIARGNVAPVQHIDELSDEEATASFSNALRLVTGGASVIDFPSTKGGRR